MRQYVFKYYLKNVAVPHFRTTWTLNVNRKRNQQKYLFVFKHRALPLFTGLVAGLMLSSTGFKPMPACVKFMMDAVPLGQDFYRVLRLASVIC